MKTQIKGTAYMFIATVLWGSSFAVRKLSLSKIGPLMQNSARFFVAGLIFIIVAFYIRKKKTKTGIKTIPLKKQLKSGILIGILYSTGAMLQQLGLSYVDAGQVGFLTSTYTIFVPVIGFVLYREKIHMNIIAGTVMAVIGLVLITGGVTGFGIGHLILILGALSLALQIVFIDRYVNDADSEILVCMQLMIGAILNLFIAYIIKEPFEIEMIRESYGAILYTGICSLGIANFCQFKSQEILEPSVAAVLCSLESVFGLVFGIILLHETVTFLQTIGCAVMLIAVITAQCKKEI